jgi:hypothetical protein
MSARGGILPRTKDGSMEHLYRGSWRSGKTRTVRVPVALTDDLLAVARVLDEVSPDQRSLIVQMLSRLKPNKDDV